jgi:hypothetical protein
MPEGVASATAMRTPVVRHLIRLVILLSGIKRTNPLRKRHRREAECQADTLSTIDDDGTQEAPIGSTFRAAQSFFPRSLPL